jgi:threonine/homoserine/homoserine lactone efflux protein
LDVLGLDFVKSLFANHMVGFSHHIPDYRTSGTKPVNSILQNIILGISIAAPLGPATITIIKSGIQGGFSSAIKVSLGVVAADTTYVFVAYFGLASLITIPVVKTLILIFGTLVLIYLGYQTIKEALSGKVVSANPQRYSQNSFFEGYAVNISNPLAVVWWLGVIGSILATTNQASTNLLTLLQTLAIVVGILTWHTGLSIVSHFSKKLLNSTMLKYFSILGGLVLFGFALRFGYNAFLALK